MVFKALLNDSNKDHILHGRSYQFLQTSFKFIQRDVPERQLFLKFSDEGNSRIVSDCLVDPAVGIHPGDIIVHFRSIECLTLLRTFDLRSQVLGRLIILARCVLRSVFIPLSGRITHRFIRFSTDTTLAHIAFYFY